MKDLEKRDYLNIMIEGCVMWFALVAILLILGDVRKQSIIYFFDYEKYVILWIVFISQLVITSGLLKIRKIPHKPLVVLSYSFVVWLIYYVLVDVDAEHFIFYTYDIPYIYIDDLFYPIFILMEIAWFVIRYIHNQYMINKLQQEKS